MKTLKSIALGLFTVLATTLIGCQNDKHIEPPKDEEPNADQIVGQTNKPDDEVVDKQPDDEVVYVNEFFEDFSGHDTLLDAGAHKLVFKNVKLLHYIGVAADNSLSAQCTPPSFQYREDGQYICDIDLTDFTPGDNIHAPDTCIGNGLYSQSRRFKHGKVNNYDLNRIFDVEFIIEPNTSSEPRQFRLQIDWGDGSNDYMEKISRGYTILQQPEDR